MGNATGSFTAKATIPVTLFPFTKWGHDELKGFLIRGQRELPDVFGLKRHEFEFLVSDESISLTLARSLFHEVFDTDQNGLVDKMEVMCMICMTSKVESREKIQFFFDLFNFNNKGYLNESELTLLIMSVSRGAFKIDQRFFPPSAKLVKEFVREAFTSYAKTEQATLRKPELVKFILDNPDMLAYFECWRGHAAQVLLLESEKWRDISFPCNETAITPSPRWRHYGLPPVEFYRWKRKDRIGVDLGMERLFAHIETFLKTIDRRRVYKGEGLLGTASFTPGYIADTWFLNAIAMLISRPETLFYLFPSTGQEIDGRHCLRFFESGGWRTVYIDDRLPCTLQNHALLSCASSGGEAWLSLLEKAMAKYLGSFADFAACTSRCDSTLVALRLLTGGHVMRYATMDYDWKSVPEDVLGKDGLGNITKYLKEGSIVGFGRSAGTPFVALPPLPIVNGDEEQEIPQLPPISRLFPIVGIKVINRYTHFILRDSWGLVGGVDSEVNYESGHSNTFTVRVEDVANLYDTMIICRFPDSLRSTTERRGFTSWTSEVYACVTEGVNQPAVFKITVAKKETNLNNNNTNNQRKYLNATKKDIDTILAASDRIEQDPYSDLDIRLKDKHDFSRVSKPPLAAPVASANTSPHRRRSSITNKSRKKLVGSEDMREKEDLVDVCLTISSTCDWSFAGSRTANAKLRMRLVPTAETWKKMEEREEIVRQRKKIEEQIKQEQLAKQNALLEVMAEDTSAVLKSGSNGRGKEAVANAMPATRGVIPVGTGRSRPNSGSSQSVTNTSIVTADQPLPVDANVTAAATKKDRSIIVNMTQAAPQSWLSNSLHLVPGTYYLFADVSFAVPYMTARLASLPRDVNEAPWLEPQLVAAAMNKLPSDIFFDADDHDNENQSQASLTSLAAMERQIFRGDSIHAQKKEAEKELLRTPLKHLLWLEATSIETISAEAMSKDESLPTDLFPLPSPLLPELIPEETWPFLVETQLEVSSRMLSDAMAALRSEADTLSQEFMTLATRFKDERKRALQREQEVKFRLEQERLQREEQERLSQLQRTQQLPAPKLLRKKSPGKSRKGVGSPPQDASSRK